MWGFLRWVSVAVMVVAVGCLARVREPVPPAGFSLGVLTYNVNWGGGSDPAATADVIASSGADIVFLQETNEGWEAFLNDRLGTAYPHRGFHHDTYRAGGGLGVLSRWPWERVAHVESDTGWFDAWVVRVDTPTGPIHVLNIHLHPPVNERGSVSISGYAAAGSARVAEIQRFMAAMPDVGPRLVVGDFNEEEGGGAIRYLESHGFTNALPQFDRRTPTWVWRTGLVTLRRRMDHVLYSPEVRCLGARVLPGGSSDHRAVLAVFEPRAGENLAQR